MTHPFEMALSHFSVKPPAEIAEHRKRIAEAETLVAQLKEQSPPDPYLAKPGGLAESVLGLVAYRLRHDDELAIATSIRDNLTKQVDTLWDGRSGWAHEALRESWNTNVEQFITNLDALGDDSLDAQRAIDSGKTADHSAALAAANNLGILFKTRRAMEQLGHWPIEWVTGMNTEVLGVLTFDTMKTFGQVFRARVSNMEICSPQWLAVAVRTPGVELAWQSAQERNDNAKKMVSSKPDRNVGEAL